MEEFYVKAETVDLIGDGGKHLISIRTGAPIVSSIASHVKKHKILGGSVSGLGIVTEPELGYWDHKNGFKREVMKGRNFEVVSLMGNVSLLNGEIFVHVHVCLGDRDYKLVGGHLFEMKAFVGCEVLIDPFGVMPVRKTWPECGNIPTIVDSTIDPQVVSEVWSESPALTAIPSAP